MFLLSNAPKIIVVFVYAIFVLLNLEALNLFGEMNESNASEILSGMSWFAGFLIICVLIPLFETFIFQLIPTVICSFLFRNRVIQVLLSASVFTFFHSSQPLIVLLIIFCSGIIYAWSFIVYKRRGSFKAIIVTTTIHGLFNFVAFLSFYLFPS